MTWITLFERSRKGTFVRKKHRLVCKAVADALTPGFPEIQLFQGWLEYRSRARRTAAHGLRHDPVLGKTQPVAAQFRPVVMFLGYDPTPRSPRPSPSA